MYQVLVWGGTTLVTNGSIALAAKETSTLYTATGPCRVVVHSLSGISISINGTKYLNVGDNNTTLASPTDVNANTEMLKRNMKAFGAGVLIDLSTGDYITAKNETSYTGSRNVYYYIYK